MDRFRIMKLSLRDILIALAILVVELGLFYLISMLTDFMISKGIIKIPVIPSVAGSNGGLDAIDKAVGGLRGNWTAFIIITKNTIFGLLIHFITNGSVLAPMLIRVIK